MRWPNSYRISLRRHLIRPGPRSPRYLAFGQPPGHRPARAGRGRWWPM